MGWTAQSTQRHGWSFLAVTYDFVTGPWLQRNATVVVDDRYYTFVIQPWDPNLFPQALPDVERLWNTASQSVAFFDPWR